MSYDVSVCCASCGSNQVRQTNMTSNCAGMWDKAGATLRDWDGKSAIEILPALQKAIERMHADPEDFKELEPSNGWGSLPAAIEFLEGIRDACAKNPDATLSVGH